MNNLTETLKKVQNANNSVNQGQIYKDLEIKRMRSELKYYYSCIAHLKSFSPSPLVQSDLMHVYKLVEKLENSLRNYKITDL